MDSPDLKGGIEKAEQSARAGIKKPRARANQVYNAARSGYPTGIPIQGNGKELVGNQMPSCDCGENLSVSEFRFPPERSSKAETPRSRGAVSLPCLKLYSRSDKHGENTAWKISAG